MTFIIKIDPDRMPCLIERGELTDEYIQSCVGDFKIARMKADYRNLHPYMRLLVSDNSELPFNKIATQMGDPLYGPLYGSAILVVEEGCDLRAMSEEEAFDICDSIETLEEIEFEGNKPADQIDAEYDYRAPDASDPTDAMPELTPEQQEMRIYERSVEVFGMSDVSHIAIHSMSRLISALLECDVHIRTDGDADIGAVNEARARVAIALNQLDVIFGDNSELEYLRLQDLEDAVNNA